MLSKIANWVVWTALTLVVLVLFYRYTDWFKPAADTAYGSVKSLVSKVPSNPFAKNASADKLASARDAFARGDVNAAVSIYGEIAKANPKNADARGELGNVYYLTGRLPEAAQAYYDAANVLLERKEYARIEPMLPAIAEFDPAMAGDIAQRMGTAVAAGDGAGPQGGSSWPSSPQSAHMRY